MPIDLILALLIALFGFVFIVYGLYIFKKIVPKVDYQLNGWNYEYDSWFSQWLRANEYTSFSMLPSRARKAGVYEKFYALDPWIRRHFIIWMSIGFVGCGLMAAAYILERYLPAMQ